MVGECTERCGRRRPVRGKLSYSTTLHEVASERTRIEQVFDPDDVRVEPELLDERRFGNGVVFLRYGVTDSP